MTPDEKTVHVERVKLMATSINTVAIAIVVSGVVLPVIALAYGGEPPRSRFWWLIGLWWLGVGIAMHVIARGILGRMAK